MTASGPSISAPAPIRRPKAWKTRPVRATCSSWNAPRPSDIARNLAGAPSREAISAYVQGDTYLVSVSYTGKKTTDGTSTGASSAPSTAQQAVIGRAAWLAVAEPDVKWLIDGHITDVLKLHDAARQQPHQHHHHPLQQRPGSWRWTPASTVDTGNIDANHVREFGFEIGRPNMAGLLRQGGWFRYEIERRIAVPNPAFHRLVCASSPIR